MAWGVLSTAGPLCIVIIRPRLASCQWAGRPVTGPFHSRERQGLIPTNAKASETWAAWRRRAAATLVWPAQRTRVLVRLRKAAITWGALPVLTWERSSSKVTSRTQCNPVLDVPMLPENPQQSIRPSNSRSHTGYRIAHRCLSPSFHRPPPLYPAYTRFHEGRLCLRRGHPSPTVPALPA